MVSERVAGTVWPHESAVGKQFKFGAAEDTTIWRTVVGVAADALDPSANAILSVSRPRIFVPIGPASLGFARVYVVLRI